ncbi:hypothetical protein [Sphingomonas sp.]|uniref:hypothetical protein n=1 Tax=Sphingomonas sp. TaxID=28214 RepID=UPI0035A9256C
MRQSLTQVMPTLLRHEGLWRGVYRHVDADGVLVDQHDVSVRCEFPEDGPYAYIQYNHFTWPDGREHRAVLPGILRDGKLWWDVETFHGYSWETEDGILLLNLTRKDEPGANFFEMITMGDTGEFRSRTWQWFRDGKLYRRTLCDEQRVAA